MPVDPEHFPRDELAAYAATATVQTSFAYRNSPAVWLFRRLPLHGELQEGFRARIESAALELRDNRVGRAYDPEWHLAPEEFFHLSNEPPPGGNFFPQLSGFAGLPEFEEQKRIRTPNAWVVAAQLEDDSLAYFGARIKPAAILRRNSPALRIVYREDAFDTLDDTVVTLSPGFDWIAWQGVMIVLNETNFHAMFRDIPALQAKVEEHMQAVTAHIGIDNVDGLIERIKSDPGKMVKLQRIIQRADMHTRPAAVLREYGENYSIHVEWNGDRMVFNESLEQQWNILSLLDEARTLGPVTGKHWETRDKIEV